MERLHPAFHYDAMMTSLFLHEFPLHIDLLHLKGDELVAFANGCSRVLPVRNQGWSRTSTERSCSLDALSMSRASLVSCVQVFASSCVRELCSALSLLDARALSDVWRHALLWEQALSLSSALTALYSGESGLCVESNAVGSPEKRFVAECMCMCDYV